jgi:hypothetical protein
MDVMSALGPSCTSGIQILNQYFHYSHLANRLCVKLNFLFDFSYLNTCLILNLCRRNKIENEIFHLVEQFKQNTFTAPYHFLFKTVNHEPNLLRKFSTTLAADFDIIFYLEPYCKYKMI